MCVALLLPSVVWGQEGGVVYERETSFDFDAEQIGGQVVRPDGEMTTGMRSRERSSLIRIRTDFVSEMVKSVESL
jgi:hypothetical protein